MLNKRKAMVKKCSKCWVWKFIWILQVFSTIFTLFAIHKLTTLTDAICLAIGCGLQISIFIILLMEHYGK